MESITIRNQNYFGECERMIASPHTQKAKSSYTNNSHCKLQNVTSLIESFTEEKIIIIQRDVDQKYPKHWKYSCMEHSNSSLLKLTSDPKYDTNRLASPSNDIEFQDNKFFNTIIGHCIGCKIFLTKSNKKFENTIFCNDCVCGWPDCMNGKHIEILKVKNQLGIKKTVEKYCVRHYNKFRKIKKHWKNQKLFAS